MPDADPYVAEWLARHPGMELAQLFAAPGSRRRFALWGTLLEEIDEATFAIGEASVAQAKLAWWSEELQRGSEPRHPLLQEFLADPAVAAIDAARWRGLGHAALRLAGDERTPADIEAALARLESYAAAVVAIEQDLFAVPAADPLAVAVERVARPLFARTARAAWPMQLLARHQVAPGAAPRAPASPAETALRRDFAASLQQRSPPPRGCWFRRSRSLLLGAQLQALARGDEEQSIGRRLVRVARLWREARRGRE